MTVEESIKVHVSFSGGLDSLFKSPSITLTLSPGSTLTQLLFHLRDTHLTGDVSLFLQGTTVRPGILVLVNDCDWELLGQTQYVLEERDQVVLISTLHGG